MTTAYQKYAATLREELKDAPIDAESFERPLSRCSNCHGFCCYDGVELEQEEAEIISTLARDEREFFISVGVDLPEQVVAPYDPADPSNIATTKRPREFSKDVPGFPGHFKDTACVFLTEKGWCSLQMLSVAKGLHKWHYKPIICWMFPLTPYYQAEKNIISIKNVESEYNPDKDPGFVMHTGCGKTDPEGTPARVVLEEEISHLSELIGRDIMAELVAKKTSSDSLP
jgi:hypothetical protein